MLKINSVFPSQRLVNLFKKLIIIVILLIKIL